jgi:Heterokaryon incompatibility protein (HET)
MEIKIYGILVRITTNLFAALTNLRKRDDIKWIWIDALCINQNDINEKNHQVSLMRQIYSRAERVLSWLGEEDGDAQLAFSLIERWAEAILSTSPTLENWPNSEPLRMAVATIVRPFEEQEWAAVWSFFRNSYWERIWIIQEVFLARQCLIICGRHKIMFDKILWVHRAWFGGDLRLTRLAEILNAASYSEQFFGFINIVRNQISETRNTHNPDLEPSTCRVLSTFPFLLRTSSNLLATDARDKIYGLIGLMNVDIPPIPVDYGKSVADVYKNVVSLLVQTTRRLDVLTFGGMNIVENISKFNLPSWVPDFQSNFTTKICEYTAFYNTLYFHASGKSSAECRFTAGLMRISINGMLCDKVAAVAAPSPNSGERLRQWLSFILGHQDHFEPRHTSVQQILFRTIITDHLWRGFESPQFLASHLEFDFFRAAAGFLSAVKCIYENKHLPYFNPSDATPQTEMSPEIKQTLGTWFHRSAWMGDNDNHPQIAAEAANFLGSPHMRDRLRWPEDVKFNKDEDGNKYIVYFSFWFSKSDSRCLFITKNGYMGVGPPSAKEGDNVFLPLGCSVPLIIRADVRNYKLVGDSYICGMMQGEMMQNLEDALLHLEEITLE